jgi:hypothetical protein
LLVQELRRVLYQHEIVQDEAPFDEGALIWCDHFVQPTSKPICHKLHEEFSKGMY